MWRLSILLLFLQTIIFGLGFAASLPPPASLNLISASPPLQLTNATIAGVPEKYTNSFPPFFYSNSRPRLVAQDLKKPPVSSSVVPDDPWIVYIHPGQYYLRFSHFRPASPAFGTDGVVETLKVARFDAAHPHPPSTWMPSRPFVYDTVVRHVEMQVVPMRMRWTEWEDAVETMLQVYRLIDPVQLLFSVHDYTDAMIAHGLLQEI